MSDKTKPEPRNAERLDAHRREDAVWGGRPYHNLPYVVQVRRELLAEIDRLSAALVAANAALVTEREAHAETKRCLDVARDTRNIALDAQFGAEARAEEAERKLAVAVEALTTVAKHHQGRTSEAGRVIREALAATTSNAPAKADTRPKAITCKCGHTVKHHDYENGCDKCSCESFERSDLTTGPASKPLVVGQRYKLGELPVGARYHWPRAGIRFTWTLTEVDDDVAYGDRDDEHRVPADSCSEVVLVSLPSPKADERKAKSTMQAICTGTLPTDSTDPAPPALTRDSTPNDWRGLKIHVFNDRLVLEDDKYVIAAVDCADILRAALSEGGAE